MQLRFPFQVNEVSTNYIPSHHPINVHRGLQRNLLKRMTHSKASALVILQGLSMEKVQWCFQSSYVYIHGLNYKTMAPKLLVRRFHLPSHKMVKLYMMKMTISL